MCGGAETKDGDNVRRIFFPHPNATLPLRLTVPLLSVAAGIKKPGARPGFLSVRVDSKTGK